MAKVLRGRDILTVLQGMTSEELEEPVGVFNITEDEGWSAHGVYIATPDCEDGLFNTGLVISFGKEIE